MITSNTLLAMYVVEEYRFFYSSIALVVSLLYLLRGNTFLDENAFLDGWFHLFPGRF